MSQRFIYKVIEKGLFRCRSSEHFLSFFFHSDTESLVIYPNHKKANFLNNDLLLTCIVHIMPKTCNLYHILE